MSTKLQRVTRVTGPGVVELYNHFDGREADDETNLIWIGKESSEFEGCFELVAIVPKREEALVDVLCAAPAMAEALRPFVELALALDRHGEKLHDLAVIHDHPLASISVGDLRAARSALLLSQEGNLGESLRDQALVNQAPTSGLGPTGFDPISQAEQEADDEELEDFHAVIADMTFDGCTPDEIAEIARRSAERSIRELNDALRDASKSDRNPQGGDPSGSVEDESAVGEADLPNSSQEGNSNV